MPTVKVKVEHRRLGTITVKMDKEDLPLIEGRKLEAKTWVGRTWASPLIIIRPENSDNPNDYFHLSREILDHHKLLDVDHNVFYKDGDSFNLTKKNLLCGKRRMN